MLPLTSFLWDEFMVFIYNQILRKTTSMEYRCASGAILPGQVPQRVPEIA
jgi:hypothetical protein